MVIVYIHLNTLLMSINFLVTNHINDKIYTVITTSSNKETFLQNFLVKSFC